MNNVKKVLVVGSAGRVGQAVVKELVARGHHVSGFDRVVTPGLPESLAGNINDAAALPKAMAGIDTVIHLAATPDDDDFFAQLLPNNISGLYHVMESARASGVKRMVLASSGQVNWWQRERGPWPVKIEDQVSPRYWYAATKMFMEAIGRGYVEMHGMSVIVARLGWCPRTQEQVEEIAAAEWARNVYLSPGDAGRFFACTVAAPDDLSFAIVFANSKPPTFTYFDPEPARKLLGYEAGEVWPDGVEIIVGAEAAKKLRG